MNLEGEVNQKQKNLEVDQRRVERDRGAHRRDRALARVHLGGVARGGRDLRALGDRQRGGLEGEEGREGR